MSDPTIEMKYTLHGWWEHEFIQILQQNFQNDELLIHRDIDGNYPDLNLVSPETIVVILADECRRQDLGKYNKAKFILAQYHDTNLNASVFNVPLGIFNTDIVNSRLPDMERRYNLAFSGCLNTHRVSLAATLMRFPDRLVESMLRINQQIALSFVNSTIRSKYPDCYFFFTGGFSAGLTKLEYTQMLLSSKSVLCPPGFTDQESFRISEALYCGCNPIIPSRLNRSCHQGLKTLDYSSLSNRSITDVARLHLSTNTNRMHYERWFSPAAVVNELISCLCRIES